jgi:hypothetical protein
MSKSIVSDEDFISLAEQNNCSVKLLRKALKSKYPDYDNRKSRVETRLNRLRAKGYLSLDSGNKVSIGEQLKGSSTLFNAAGEVQLQWIKTDVAKENTLNAFNEAIDSLIKRLPYAPATTLPEPQSLSEDTLAVYPLGDVHLGMYANNKETDNTSNNQIIMDDHTKAVEYLVSQAPSTKEAFIIDVGDYMHSDNNQNKTSKSGNALDVDGRFAEVLELALDLATKLVSIALTKHQTVHWRSVAGNHNEHTALVVNKYVRAYFRNEPRVIVHDSPTDLYYHQFGKVLLGMTHGHQVKADKLGEVMSVDCAKIWSSTNYRYWITGHVHHQSVKEYPSCVVETFRTLTGKDTWHYSSGYRSGQDMHCIVYHKDYGEVSRNKVSIDKVQSLT